ncbi:hypothetical protein AWB68_06589 [Caballeronia choica]|uniref:Uncharacterized protein n=1 Tax=Caballeronia choica TaxID=326476 RepID=A0A158KN59_9BURK|nr:hypothetical protein [Caballeronia choica]SAL82618.1 hypothetical protein AWB68_06589 [Caballeronia choica]
MSLPPTVVCWITPGVRAQLQAFADSQGIPAEQCTGEAITAYLRAEGAPPADPVPAEIAVAQIRPPLPLVLEALRMSESNPD